MIGACGLPPLTGYTPTGVLVAGLGVVEVAHRVASWVGLGWKMTLTRYSVLSITTDFFFTHAAATRDFGYRPLVGHADGRARTKVWLKTAGY